MSAFSSRERSILACKEKRWLPNMVITSLCHSVVTALAPQVRGESRGDQHEPRRYALSAP